MQIAESDMLCLLFQNMRHKIVSLTTELLIVDSPVVFVVSPSSSSDDDIPRSSKLNSASSTPSVSPGRKVKKIHYTINNIHANISPC